MAKRRSSKFRSVGICAAIAVGASLVILAPPAMAAPANDAFANRTDLGNALPVHVSESNVGATKEAAGEPWIGSLANAGHSIWWQWEAPATEWITVSTCGSDFLTNVGVFEGTELGHLKSLFERPLNGVEGPACWASGTTFTFRAAQGTRYAIGADGNSFYPPPLPGEEPHIPSGEGEVVLSIEATPPPPNDDFAAATRIGNNFSAVNESPFEPPNDDRYFWEQTTGYNWGATKQPGEPEHAGNPGGASVWYAWTPTESGEARISLQGAGGPKLLALYSGSSLTGLTPIAESGEAGSAISAEVTGGVEYRIAVDGSQSENALEPWRGSFMGSFNLAIQLKLPPAPAPKEGPPCACAGKVDPPPPPAQVLPTVKVAGHRVDAGAGTATFRFGSPTAGAIFRCKVDRQSYKACSSPFQVKGLKPGRHRFQVLVGIRGTWAATPATVKFTVPPAHRRHHAAR
jgi:hypothetical protein